VINVLIVEDDPASAEAQALHVSRVPGFTVVGRARTGAEALRILGLTQVDLVMLDIYLPDMHGLDIVRVMRAAGRTADVIVVTRARDLRVVKAAVAFGIVHYLVKPATFSTVRDKLERYLAYRHEVTVEHQVVTQGEVDHLLGALRGANTAHFPKGMSRESLDAVVAALKSAGAGTGLSAAQVGAALGASRVTARRYLQYLVELGLACRQSRYGGAHRPEVEYRWLPHGDGHGPHADPFDRHAHGGDLPPLSP
jgi:response regulator of citrate/malate metabolism